VAGRVRFLGALDRALVQDLYRQAAVVVVPSVWPEPFGMVGPEAMSFGVPVVAFRVGGVPEWLHDGETGYLVEPRDIYGLAQRIELLLRDAPLARRLGERGRQLVQERFTIPQHVDRLEQIFASAVEGRRR
jgi:glycosyltransferase involved in cell wall biosynthesis